MQWLYLNGRLVRHDDAAISAFGSPMAHPTDPSDDHTLIETFRSHEGRVFRLARHYERLCAGALVLGLTVPLTLPELESAVAQILARNKATDARLRLTVGDGGDMNVTLTAAPLTDYPPELYRRGMHATVADVRRNEASPLSRVKCAAGLHNGILARQRAREAGFGEAIMLNSRGLIAEATVSNVFAMAGGRLLTPTIESGALPGVTRAAVLDLSRESGIEAVETELTLNSLRTADEAFLTNSVMGVMPLTRLEDAPVGDGAAGPATKRLSQLYRDAVSAVT